jgi:BirA family biotin operon repressor/biotin-[acetyl-CoA-carboxylase] ligase
MTRAVPVGRVVRVGRVESTQSVAFALAAEGAVDRTVVVADSQAAGRGRRGHAWLDEPGASLLVSIVLRPRLETARLPWLSLAAGVAVADALAEIAGLGPRLKWPNDVLVGGRKIAGILLESRLGPAPLVVLGIGVNLMQRTFPPELDGRATSVALETGGDVDREALLGALLEGLDRQRWRDSSETLGRTVRIDGVSGVAVDIDDDGALVVVDGDQRRRVVAGEIA